VLSAGTTAAIAATTIIAPSNPAEKNVIRSQPQRNWGEADFCTEPKTKTGKPHGYHMDDRLGRIGKNGSRMRREIDRGLTDQHCQTNNQGKTHSKMRIAQLPLVSPCCGPNRGLCRQALYLDQEASLASGT
jgi:hypothetical protein